MCGTPTPTSNANWLYHLQWLTKMSDSLFVHPNWYISHKSAIFKPTLKINKTNYSSTENRASTFRMQSTFVSCTEIKLSLFICPLYAIDSPLPLLTLSPIDIEIETPNVIQCEEMNFSIFFPSSLRELGGGRSRSCCTIE